MKVLLINSQFERGGAARVASVMCNGFIEHRIDLLVISDITFSKVGYKLDSTIHIVPLFKKTRNKTNLAKISKSSEVIVNIRNTIKEFKPDVIIAIEAYMYLRTFVANMFLKYPIIAADHTSFDRKIDKKIDFTRYHLYKYAKGLTILTEKDKILLGNKYPQKEVIYNPLPFNPLDVDKISIRRKNILVVGRLDVWYIKGIDIILNIWSELAGVYPNWSLEIAGDGNKNTITTIKEMIAQHKLTERVRLLGLVNDMRSLYQETSIFALPSRIEGFPMALMEAMSQGCATVSFSIHGATKEMVRDGAGIIVDDGNTELFKMSLVELIENDNKRERMTNQAIESVRRFSQESFVNHWIDYINKILNKS